MLKNVYITIDDVYARFGDRRIRNGLLIDASLIGQSQHFDLILRG